MAITLVKKFSIDLGMLVDQAISNASSVKRQNAAKVEADFQKAVAEGTMDYSSQISLREEQLKKERESSFFDQDTVDTIETSIKNLKKLSRFQTIRNKYNTSLNDYLQSRESISAHIDLLENTLNEEVDPTMRTELTGMLTQVRQEQATIEINAIKNRATLAEKDRSLPLIEQSIKELTQNQAKASASGKEDEATTWAETLITLKQSKAKIEVENAANEMSYKIAKFNLKASEKIGIMNDEISNSDASIPITVNNVLYTSQKAFWEQRRGEYIQSSYFDELAKEIDDETNKIKSSSKYGQVPAARIESVSKFYNDLKSQSAFAPYAETLEQKRVATVATYASDLADSVQREFDASEHSEADVLKAEQAISNIENKFSVKVSRLPFVAVAKEKSIAETLNQDLKGVKPLAGGVKEATLYDPAGKATPEKVPVGSYRAAELQTKGWKLEPTKSAVVPVAEKPAATPAAPAPIPVANNTPSTAPQGTNTLKAYNDKGEAVYVTPGKYYRGVSMTPPKTVPTEPTKLVKVEPTPAVPKAPPVPAAPTPAKTVEPNILTLKNKTGQTMQVPKGDAEYWNKQGWN